jgi:hypothetical protein
VAVLFFEVLLNATSMFNHGNVRVAGRFEHAGHEAMVVGIEQFRDPKELRLDRMLLQPFRDDRSRHRPGRREPVA